MGIDSSFLLKALAVGGVATLPVGVGGYLYLNRKAWIDELAFSEKSKTTSLDWEVKLINPSSESNYDGSGSSMDVKVSVVGTEKSKNPRTWTCDITGRIGTVASNSSMGTKEQIETALGISSSNRTPNNKVALEKFFKNCKKHRKATPNSSDASGESVINLGELSSTGDDNNKKYKFNEERFKKLFEGEIPFLQETLKEWEGQQCETQNGCSLTEEKLKTIKFSGKATTELGTQKTSKLKIEKTNDTTMFPEGMKFIFIPDQKLEVKDSSTDTVPFVLQKGANTELRIREDWTGGYFLEKAWDVTKLAEKAGLNCPKDTDGTKACKIEATQKINVFKDSENYVIGASFADVTNKKITFEKDQENYNQGFKFIVSDSNISLNTTSEDKKGTVSSLEKDNASYEVKPQILEGGREVWFLTEIKTTPS